MKKVLLTLTMGLLVATQTINAQIPNYVPTNGLIGWWGFNGNANDSSQNANNGKVNGATLTTDRFGNINSAYNFNGVNSTIDILNSDSQLIYGLQQAVTVSMWVLRNDNSDGDLMSKGCHSTNAEYGNKYFAYGFDNNNTLNFSLYNSSTVEAVKSPNNFFNIGNWYHLTIVRDTNIKCYINGIDVTTNPNNNGWNIDYNSILNNTSLTIGARNFKDDLGNKSYTNYFNGKIDDIAIFNRALTQNEINNLYNFNISVCETIGQDKDALYNAGYICGPEAKVNECTPHTETKWIDTKGVKELYLTTMQHRYYDKSRIYDENNNIIFEWNGEDSGQPTWYPHNHIVNISGNNKVRLEFYQGYPNFCVGYIKVTSMTCMAQTLGNEEFNKSTVTVYPNPTSDYLNLNIDDEVNVKIFDLLGKMVMNQKVIKQISLSNLNKGLYLVEVSNNDIHYNTKIIKN